MLLGTKKRLERLIEKSRALIISPVDDSLLAGPFGGLENMEHLLQEIVSGRPSAILAFRGTLERFSTTIGKTPTILNCTASVSGPRHTEKVQVHKVKEAHEIGADAIAAHFNLTADSELVTVKLFAQISAEARDLGLPVVAIAYPRKSTRGKDDNHLELKRSDQLAYANLVAHSVRVAVELGADIVKTHYTGSAESFVGVVNAAQGVPLVVSGGPKVDEGQAIINAAEAVKSGAKGISFGRNVFERDKPSAFLRQLRFELESS